MYICILVQSVSKIADLTDINYPYKIQKYSSVD